MYPPGSILTRESIHRPADPDSGASIVQLTSSPAIHSSIYGEWPWMDGGSRYVLLLRAPVSHGPFEVWRADLQDHLLVFVCSDVQWLLGAAVSPDQRYFFCMRAANPQGETQRWNQRGMTLVRTDIATLEQDEIDMPDAPRPQSMLSVSPDGRTFIYGHAFGPERFGIIEGDLVQRTWRLIHEDPEICNPHPMIEPGAGTAYLIQHNRGCHFAPDGRCLHLVRPPGATLYLIDAQGNKTQLPVGEPWTAPVQGHQCWIGMTGEILLTTSGPATEEFVQQGNLLAVRPGDEQARVAARGHLYCHPNASRDGRFFVADVRAEGTPLVVGSLRTGRNRVLCRTGASLSRPQYTHPHPYFSPDRRWVVYTSDATGVPHVYAARVPDGLLEELEDD